MCGVHLQTLYLNECGVFPTVLPRIKSSVIKKCNVDPDELDKDYKEFVLSKRRLFAKKYKNKINILPEPDLTASPFKYYRESLGANVSRMGFAKDICVEPAGLYRLERVPLNKLPGRLTEALLQVGLTPDNLEELEERTNEFYARS